MSKIKHDYADIELLYNDFTEPAARKALQKLEEELPKDPKILDAGCGPGSHFKLFDEVFESAEVTAIDISEPHLERAKEKARNLDTNIETLRSDLTDDLELEPETFDLIWFGDVICPSDIGNPVQLLSKMEKYLGENGLIAVFYGNWLRQQFMPGYARLEHKINAAYELMHETKNLGKPWQGPDHPEKALKWLQESGYRSVEQDFYTAMYSRPEIDEEALKYVKHVFENDYSDAVDKKGEEAGITEEERSRWGKISTEDSILYLLDKEGYYCSMQCMLAYAKKLEA